MTTQPVLVTGATGYVGGRLVPKLLNGRLSGPCFRAFGRQIKRTSLEHSSFWWNWLPGTSWIRNP